jgi:hypothetical protein
VIKLVNRLGVQKVLPVTFSLRSMPLDIQVPYQPLYGRDGAVKTGKSTMLPRQFTLQGTIIHRSKQDTRQELDELLPFLMEPPIEVYRHHDDTRHLRAHPVGAPQDWLTGDAEVQLRVPMVALDPYWYSAQEQELTEAHVAVYYYTLGDPLDPEARWICPPYMPAETEIYKAVDVWLPQPVQFDIDNRGSAAAYPIITITGRSFGGLTKIINPKLSNLTNGQCVKYSGTLLNGQSVIFDTDNFTVVRAGNNELGNANAEFLLSGWQLEPGTNELQIEWDADPLASAKIGLRFEYRERWY